MRVSLCCPDAQQEPTGTGATVCAILRSFLLDHLTYQYVVPPKHTSFGPLPQPPVDLQFCQLHRECLNMQLCRKGIQYIPMQTASQYLGLTQHATIFLIALLALALVALELCIHTDAAPDSFEGADRLPVWKWLLLSTLASIRIYGRRGMQLLCSLYTNRSKGELHAANTTTNTPHPV
jgi:hypothetical protein